MPEWERVPLGDVLVSVPASRREAVDPDKEYRLLGVRLNNEGAFLRETKKGSESSAPSLYRVESGDFIYSRLFAWRGAFGLIPPELDGCYVSNEFPLFRAKDDRLDLEWLDFWFHLQDVIRTVEADCTGSTPLTRNRYKETFFLALEIPLPPLPEQQRIVARVKGMLNKVEEARRLREEVEVGYQQFLRSKFNEITADADSLPLSEVAPIVKRQVEIQPKIYREIGARSFGKGLFTKPDFSGAEATWQKPVWIKNGDLVLSNIKAWEGAIAPADAEQDGMIASHRYITCVPVEGVTLADYLAFYLLTPNGLEQVGNASPGTADRNRTTGVRALGQIQIPMPAFAKQQEFSSLLGKLKTIRQNQADSNQELQALPSSILAQAFAGAL